MTEKVSRRNAMVLGLGASATPAWTLPIGGEIDTTTQGINIKLFWSGKLGWTVAIPDFDYMKGKYWTPGQVIEWKHVPLVEYLKGLEDYFELKVRV